MAYRMNQRPAEAKASERLFGTDGVRGVANVFPMTAEVAMQLGRALAYLIRNGNHRHRVVIGKDTRLSGYMLEQALAAGITSMGVDVAMVGPLPTPGIANITTSMRADAGAVISASHNPYQDNGIKFFWRDGFKLPDETEAKIEGLLSSREIDQIRPTATKIGRAIRLEDARGRYVVFLKNTFPRELTLEGMTIVVDCANGAAYKIAPAVLEELGAKVIALGVEPDGKNINHKCGALHPENLARAVLKHGANLGIALDGDADRLIVVDEKGKVVDGDAIMAICTGELVARRELKKKTLVATVMSNVGLERAVARLGREGRAHPRRRSLRRRGDAQARLQPRRRAVGPPAVPRPRDHRRRHPRGAADARGDVPPAEAGLRAGVDLRARAPDAAQPRRSARRRTSASCPR